MRWESKKGSEIAGVVEVESGRRDHEPAWCVCVRVCVYVCRSGRSVVCLRRHGYTHKTRERDVVLECVVRSSYS